MYTFSLTILNHNRLAQEENNDQAKRIDVEIWQICAKALIGRWRKSYNGDKQAYVRETK